jgi:MFS family permease
MIGDNPMTETTATPHQGRHLLVCCAIGFFCFFGAYMRIPVLPLFAASLGAGTAQVGMINAAFMLSAGLLAIPAGLLSDRLGRRTMLLGGLLTISCSSLLIPVSSGPLMLAMVYLLFGVGLAAFTPSMMSLVADITPRSQLGRAYSMYTTAVYVGMTFGPAVGGFLGRLLGLGRVFLVSGGLIMLVLLLALATLPRSGTRSLHDEELHSLRTSMTVLLGNKRLIACLTGTVGGCFGFGMYISFLPLHARFEGLDATHIGMIFAAQAAANALLRIPFGRLSDRTDRGVMAAAGLMLFALALGATGFFRTSFSLSASAAILGTGMGFGFTALGALVADVAPRELRGLALGLYNSCIYLGMTLSSATMGIVINTVGFRNGFLISGFVSLVMTMIFYFLYRQTSDSHCSGETGEKPPGIKMAR